MNPDLPPSKLYNFLDAKNHISVSFLEGQKLHMDLVLMDQKQDSSFQFFRELVLASTHFIQLLKHGEQLGFYIDSTTPKFLYKIECHSSGTLRTLLLPKDLAEVPQVLTGQVRLSKILPGAKNPYQSILEIKNQTFADVINHILEKSYQIKATVLLSPEKDQSIMLSQIPRAQIKSDESELEPKLLKEYLLKFQKDFNHIFSENILDHAKIVKSFEQLGFTYLQGREVKFHCPCSKESILAGIFGLLNMEHKELFGPENQKVEVTCDYCQSTYEIFPEDLTSETLQ